MKTLRRLLVICVTILAFGCAHTPSQKSPFVIGSAYSITSSGAYWLLKIDGSDMKVHGPIRVRILELRPPAWARVQLLDEKRSPFWINLQDATSINEIK
jgi:hypothetical protein